MYVEHFFYKTIFVFCVMCCAVGSHEARERSVVRCMAWKTETCGARPAAGRKPARDLLTETAATAYTQKQGGLPLHA